jgi:hypothetical protein
MARMFLRLYEQAREDFLAEPQLKDCASGATATKGGEA